MLTQYTRRNALVWLMYFVAVPCDFFYYFDTWQKTIEENKDVQILVVHFEDIKRVRQTSRNLDKTDNSVIRNQLLLQLF